MSTHAPISPRRHRQIASTSFRAVLAVAVALATWCIAGLGRAEADTTPVNATPSQVASQLFVAGDVGRLSVVPSGTESVVLEKILQQLYAQTPSLGANTAISDIQGLEAALAAPGAPTPATLTVMSANQRILTILDALEASGPPSDVSTAIAAVARDALTQSSAALASSGQYFDASADALSTLSTADFSPARVLEDTVTLAGANASFAQARDALWAAASHEHVLDTTNQLLVENPALQNGAVQALVSELSNGSFSADEGTVLLMIGTDEQQIENQTCTPGGPTAAPSAGQQPDCSSGALHDAELIAAACPNGTGSSDPACQAAVSSIGSDPQQEANTIAADEAAATAAAGLLGSASAQLQTAEQAAAATAAQVAQDENAYLNAQAANAGIKLGEDVVSLGITLSVSEIDPVLAVSNLFSVINDVIGFGAGAPDPNQIIITGLQNISQQITDFEQYTQAAFTSISTQLGALSSQIAQETYALTTQLTNAQQQVTQISASIANLQNSVDQLQSEVQSLFAANANNDLSRITTESLGYATVNGRPLPADMFSTSADDLFQDATGTALSQTVLAAPGPFDAADASSQLTGGGSDPLNTNINYLNFFPSLVSDSPTGPLTSAPLTAGCAANAAGALCLPNPAFWASSSRAFAQLLLENPQQVTPARLTQLQSLIAEGSTVQSAIAKISANDAGADPGGTGSTLLDGLLKYYQYWAVGAHPVGTPPSLQQALLNEEQAYLASQTVPAEPITFSGVSPWDGVNQTPDYTGLLDEPQFQNVKVCDPNFTSANGDTTLPRLSQTLLQFVPANLLNGARVGVNDISVCWTAQWDNGSPGQGNYGELNVSLIFFGNVPQTGANGNTYIQPYEIAYLNTDQPAYDNYNGDGISDALATVTLGWQSGFGGTDVSTSLAPLANAIPQYNLTTVGAYSDPLTQSTLASLQAGIDKAIGGTSLTTGTSPDTDIAAAAQRLDGASTLLADYVRLGFSQALASDDTLQELINGSESDVFAYPGVNLFGTTMVDGVAAQLLRYYSEAANTPGVADPALSPNGFADAVRARVAALRTALSSYVQTGRATGQSASDGGALAQSSPVIASTLARLRLSDAVLADELNGTLPLPGAAPAGSPTTTTTAGGSSPTGPTGTGASGSGTPTTATTAANPLSGVTSRTGGAGAARTLTVKVRCSARTCHERIIATVTERLRGGRVLALGPTGRLPRGQTRRTVTVAAVTISVARTASRPITLVLNATGTTLLSRFRRLPLTITVAQRGTRVPGAVTVTHRTLSGA